MTSTISCSTCKQNKNQDEISKLKCTHSFCWKCLDEYLHKNLNVQIKCPIASCGKFLTDKEIRQVLSDDDTELYDKKIMGLSSDIQICLLPNCGGIVVCNDANTQYTCSLCNLYNCTLCKVPHAGYKCNGYQSLPPEVKKQYVQVEMKKAEQVYRNTEIVLTQQKKQFIAQTRTVTNSRRTRCRMCNSIVIGSAGIVLKNCLCEICKPCLVDAILASTSMLVLCPICYEQHINSEEIQTILSPAQLSTYNNNCSNIAKTALESSLSSQPNVWNCIVCKTLLQKVSGSNWIRCSGCQTELCWIRKMKRWGPQGRGDTSDGCKCGVNGVPCHVDCKSTCEPLN